MYPGCHPGKFTQDLPGIRLEYKAAPETPPYSRAAFLSTVIRGHGCHNDRLDKIFCEAEQRVPFEQMLDLGPASLGTLSLLGIYQCSRHGNNEPKLAILLVVAKAYPMGHAARDQMEKCR